MIIVDLPSAGFSFEAATRAAYVLMKRVSISFEQSPDLIRCMLTGVAADIDMETAERDFRREVLDQQLRLSLEAKTSAMRDAILGLAFSRTGLQDG